MQNTSTVIQCNEGFLCAVVTANAIISTPDMEIRGKMFKSNFHYTRVMMPKRVTSGGAHLRSLAPGQHGFKKR